MLEKFKTLYEKKYNIALTDEEATEMATAFLNLMKILIYPKPKLKNNQVNPEEGKQHEINGL